MPARSLAAQDSHPQKPSVQPLRRRKRGIRRDGRTLRTISANLRLTEGALGRLLSHTGSSTDYILSSADGKVTVRVRLEVSSVPAVKLVIGKRCVVLDWSRSAILRNDNQVTLIRLELRLLAAIAEAAPEPASRRQLINRLWPTLQQRRWNVQLASAVAVCSLRKRFATIGVCDSIRTLRGVRYALVI